MAESERVWYMKDCVSDGVRAVGPRTLSSNDEEWLAEPCGAGAYIVYGCAYNRNKSVCIRSCEINPIKNAAGRMTMVEVQLVDRGRNWKDFTY